MKKKKLKYLIFFLLFLLLVLTLSIVEIFYVVQEDEYTQKNRIKTVLLGFQKVCSETESTCFACSGTVLGAVRHGDIIWHDDDIDVGILEEDVGKIDIFCKNSPDWGWRPSEFITDKSLWQFFHRCSEVEIDVFIHVKKKSQNAKTTYSFVGQCQRQWPRYFFESSPFAHTYRLGKIDTRNEVFQNSLQFFSKFYDTFPQDGILDLYVKGPENAHIFLERAYGKNWHVPMITHFHSIVSFRNSVFYFIFVLMVLVCYSTAIFILCFTECIF